ncbi:hypothetical protein [Stenotrophomonas sp. Sm0041]|uniref:hypothetical protein n=1 Tax=Stenotrophomonas sp. Sm0041 TaxID=3002751 RepID=UPI0027E584BD|nr:hypothetical protein [Stenotrophomonas sp. Sm0041]MDQ7292211.1 hypothetical protein [Stenotrophomonas sp. Sm0041]
MSNNLDWLNGLAEGQADFDAAIRQLDSKFSGVSNFLAWRETVLMAQSKYPSDMPGVSAPPLYVAHRWLQLAEAGCLDVRVDPARGLIVEEKLGDDSARLGPSSEVIRNQISKLIFKKLNELPDGRMLQIYELAHAFQTATKKRLADYQQELEEVIEDLSEKSYIQHRTRGLGGMILFCKGIDFDVWQDEIMSTRSRPAAAPSPSPSPIPAPAAPASHTYIFHAPVASVQTGANAVAHVQQTADQSQFAELKSALEAVLAELAKSNLPADEREDVRELVRTTITEVEKEKPNKLTVRTMLGGIATTVQTLGSSSDAYKVFKAAAAVVGVTLP